MECTTLSGNNCNDWKLVQPQSKYSLQYCHSIIPPATSIIAKGDSAASNHYFALRDAAVLDEVRQDQVGTSVMLPDASSLTSVASAHLPLSKDLTPKATKTALFDNLQSSLISLGQLCDDNCTVVLNKRNLFAIKNNNVVYRPYYFNSSS